jgi:putative Mg2+ transporter-C (MgtC) family protein
MGHGDIALRLVVAALCGVATGVQFELRDMPGGIRTHVLTAVGAAAFCLTGASVAAAPVDAIRIIQGVASGVGFIGAAAVLRSDGRVRGTATAASLWITAAIGCQAGLGSIPIALGLAVFATIANVAPYRFELGLRRRFRRQPSATKVDAAAR